MSNEDLEHLIQVHVQPILDQATMKKIPKS